MRRLTLGGLVDYPVKIALVVTVLTATVVGTAPPATAAEPVTARLGYFYPFVQDGYRDTEPIDYNFGSPSRFKFVVLDDDGDVVFSSPYYTGQSSGTLRWGGRDNSGRLVKAGKYRVWWKATRSNGSVISGKTDSFKATTGWVNRYQKSSKDGSAGRFDVHGDCKVSTGSDFLFNYADIDCRDGKTYANYYFSIPARAEYLVVTLLYEGDGDIDLFGRFNTPTLFRAVVEVHDDSVVRLDWVGLRVTYKIRI